MNWNELEQKYPRATKIAKAVAAIIVSGAAIYTALCAASCSTTRQVTHAYYMSQDSTVMQFTEKLHTIKK